ncbi:MULTISPECIES: SigE family RNA polymerase sigma factor [unclassified Parafrankia]|uniref:SigE family RNA polymerase sigma factor n=1 Tax=unclassified Parafrankia TaxID=2994368 RepID=UPI000DA576A5|nr:MULTISPECIES: SigE family RNA polymerase sigma factor [unclassified Parafrankia]TCJ35793.1 SigE family RNA polymerase sigma factor [Parafrankia sp. BMG5.11]SQD98452.1 RNA polymerase, sigma-24 subunit, ECF subfamily [Parafrankia sp. Ea1.12]
MAERSASKTATFELFVATRGTAMLRTAVFLAGDPHTGEDLLQDVLLRVYRHWRRVDDPDAYVRRALVNAAASRRRRRRFREDPLDTAAEPIADSAPDGTDALSTRDQLFAALRQLPPRQRAVIVLRYFDDLTETQIATAVGCTPGSVKTHAARGLARLRTVLGPEYTPAERSGAHD